jgi:phosphoglycerate dehydrogenase-like enzyme
MTDSINVMLALTKPIPDHLLDILRAESPRLQVEMQTVAALTELGEKLADVEVLLTTFGLPAAAQAPRLRWVQTYFAGVDGWLERSGERVKDVLVTTASGVHGPNMAEYALLLMLAFAHALPEMQELQRRAEWPAERRKSLVPGELRGATLGVVGYGSIGREAARLARALGLRVVGCKRDPQRREDTGWAWPGTGDPRGELPERIYAVEDLDDMLRDCDYVLLTLSLTPATRHIIDSAALRAMKPGAVLINVARGGLVDEPALVEALSTGHLRGAGLDVFEQEPLPADSPLWSFPNVILTPHISGITPAYEDRLMALFAENLRRYMAGQTLLNLVDLYLGY